MTILFTTKKHITYEKFYCSAEQFWRNKSGSVENKDFSIFFPKLLTY